MKKLRRISSMFIILFILFSVNVFADYKIGEIDSTEDPLYYTRKVDNGNEKAINENSKNGIMLMSVEKTESLSSIISKYEDGNAAVGIDVSSYQRDIDWPTVAKAGVKFAIIRCGYRGLTGGEIYEDKYFKQNIEGAINNGIYVGVYFYSTALNEQEAIEEADFTLNMIKGYDIKYFVAYDFENFVPDDNRTDNLDVGQINKNAQTFLNRIKEKGYNTSLYGSASFFTDYWNMSNFTNHDVWTAHYRVSKPKMTSNYNMWQYTDSGIIPGIDGNVDVDIDYTYYFIYNNIDITPYMFDATFYADCYPDIKSAFGYNSVALKNHYINNGIYEGRMASPIFNPKYYRDKYPDLKSSFGNNYKALYDHFINYGAKEGRQGSKYIDSVYYLQQHGDLRKTFYSSRTRALAHFITNGLNEGRLASTEFDVKNYKKSVSVYYQAHLGNNYFKYIALSLGGSPISDNNIDISGYIFDARFYADKYPDLKSAFGYNEAALKNHFDTCGRKEGRQASVIFDPQFYYNNYNDIQSSYGRNYSAMYDHFIVYGALEGRAGSNELNVKNYVNRYSDIEAAFGTYYTKAIQHFVSFGFSEGRQGN